jgi:hypothetical protein
MKEEVTPELRFAERKERRLNGVGDYVYSVKRILQQRWAITTELMPTPRYEWRDVPVVSV